ncbi:MAG: alpha/beta fold hydrolase [Terriglobia bacterium]
MRPRRRRLLLLLLFAAAAGASWLGLLLLRQDFVFEAFHVGATEPIPVERVRLAQRDSYPVHFLLIHGYGANRRHLLPLAEVLAAAGGDVYLFDLPGRGDHRGAISPRPREGPHASMPTPRETAAALAVADYLQQRLGVRRNRLVLVGHSLGGGVALDLARRITPAATVSLAGLERPVEPGLPPNLLLITARLEIPGLRHAADRMYERARDGGHVARREFLASHSSLPQQATVQRAIIEWSNRVLPEARLSLSTRFNILLFVLIPLALLSLAALFVPLASLAGAMFSPLAPSEDAQEVKPALRTLAHLAGYALLAGLVTVASLRLLKWFALPHPLSFLRIADGDYLASLLLLATPWLLPLVGRLPRMNPGRATFARAGVALGLAAYVIVVGGGFLTWQLFDFWPTPERFLRLLLLAALLLPYALGEELLVRRFAGPRHEGRALVAFLLWRTALLVALFFGVIALASGQALLLILSIPLLLLSLVQHFFSAVLRRALGSAYASALFNALLLGWIIATLFPLH